ncbi:hypothetical protein C0J52_03364 [Blattella germanica]|nr:hypothetical protein C0J52_03364 [Blattella germanica]
MFVIKIFIFPLTCILAKIMLTTGDCINIKGQRNFNFKDYSGVWHARYLSRTLLPFFTHFSADKQVVQDEVIINGFLLPIQSVVGRYSSVRGKYKIPEDNSSVVQFQFLHPFASFNGNYTLISDYDCYLITHGCSREYGIGSTSLGFRDENPE